MSRTLPWTRGPAEGGSPAGPAATASLAYRAGRFVRVTLRPREWSARRITVVLLLVVAGVFTLALARGWALANQVPAWWTSAGVMEESSAAARAEGVEKGVTAALYSHRPDAQEWTVELRGEDANAWMRERLHRWLTNRGERWPQGISPPRVLLEDGRITIGVALRRETDARERIVSVSFRPELDANGALLASEANVSVGRALLPGVGGSGGAWATWLPEDWTRGQSGEWLAAVLSRRRPLLEETSLTLEDGRSVSLRSLAIEQGRLRITCVSHNGVEPGSQ